MSDQEPSTVELQFQPPNAETLEKARVKTDKVGVPRGQIHFFLCVGPDCCNPEFGLGVWSYLKRRCKELEPLLGGPSILRTKAACLRICQGLGPNMVVYPSGRWYHGLNEANCERVLQYELFGKGSVDDLLVARSGEAL